MIASFPGHYYYLSTFLISSSTSSTATSFERHSSNLQNSASIQPRMNLIPTYQPTPPLTRPRGHKYHSDDGLPDSGRNSPAVLGIFCRTIGCWPTVCCWPIVCCRIFCPVCPGICCQGVCCASCRSPELYLLARSTHEGRGASNLTILITAYLPSSAKFRFSQFSQEF